MKTAKERFWEKVHKTKDCWLWIASLETSGYGYFKLNGKSCRAHRVVWEWTYGPIPDGMCVCHRCDNPICVRPSHLFVGTVADNIRDAVAKGRQAKGERSGRSKLTTHEVLEIRREYGRGDGTHRSLAKKYGISKTHVGALARCESWRHI